MNVQDERKLFSEAHGETTLIPPPSKVKATLYIRSSRVVVGGVRVSC